MATCKRGDFVFFPLTFALNILVNTDSKGNHFVCCWSLCHKHVTSTFKTTWITRKKRIFFSKCLLIFRSIFKTVFPGLLSLIVVQLRRNVCCGGIRCSHRAAHTPWNKEIDPIQIAVWRFAFFSLTPLHTTSRTKKCFRCYLLLHPWE